MRGVLDKDLVQLEMDRHEWQFGMQQCAHSIVSIPELHGGNERVKRRDILTDISCSSAAAFPERALVMGME